MKKETYKVIFVGNENLNELNELSTKYYKDFEKIGKKIGFCTGFLSTLVFCQFLKIEKLEKRIYELENTEKKDTLEETVIKE